VAVRHLRIRRLRGEGQLVFNNAPRRLASACDGLGIAYVPESFVLEHVADARLVHVLKDCCEPFSGYHLCYSSRRHPSPAFALFVDTL